MKVSATQRHIVLVTPVYHDTERLSVFGPSLAQALKDSPLPVLWVVADDGSGDEESRRVQELVEKFRKIHPEMEFFEKGEHLGKGGTVRSAWAAYPDADWLGFIDADGSVDGASIVNLMQKAHDAGPGHAILASRKWDRETIVVQKPLRKLTHRIFAAIARNLLKLPVHDPQCGAKIIDAAAFRDVAPQLMENGFAFDGELLVALRRHAVELIEVPVNWEEKGGGSVRAVAVAGPMLASLLRIRKRTHSGHYDPK